MKTCGKGGKHYSDRPALSRKDNITEICPSCEIKEALEELEQLKRESTEKDEYILDLEEECENLSEYNRLLVERVKELEDV